MMSCSRSSLSISIGVKAYLGMNFRSINFGITGVK